MRADVIGPSEEGRLSEEGRAFSDHGTLRGSIHHFEEQPVATVAAGPCPAASGRHVGEGNGADAREDDKTGGFLAPAGAAVIAELLAESACTYIADVGDLETGITSGLEGVLHPAKPGRQDALRYALIWCPEVPSGTGFVLVRRHEDGTAERLEWGVLNEAAPSLNLARLRQQGAQLGANEVVLILP